MATDPKALVKRYYQDVYSSGDLSILDEIAVTDFDEHDPLPGQGTGIDGFKDRVRMLRDGIAPVFTIQDVVTDGASLVVRWTNNGTHVGAFMGIPPTNRAFSLPGIDIFRLRDGKLAEHWHVVDQIPFMQALGMIPSPEGASA